MRGWSYYGTKTLQMVPYMPGTPVYFDGSSSKLSALSNLYYQTREEGKIPLVFCGDDMNHEQFIHFFTERKTMQILCRVEDDKTLKPRGYCWVDTPRGVDGARAAHCGFCFFGDATEDRAARDLAALGLAYWFEDLQIDVIHGLMLGDNIPARNFASKLGFVHRALVPRFHSYEGKLVDARVMSLEKKDFMPSFEQWRENNPPPD